jgi:hypothetical protein
MVIVLYRGASLISVESEWVEGRMGGHSVGIVSGYDTTIVRWRTKEVWAILFAVGDATIFF